MKTALVKSGESLLRGLLLCALLAAMFGTCVACGVGTEPETAGPDEEYTVVGDDREAQWFYFEVTDSAGAQTRLKVYTDKTILGEALVDEDLVKGSVGKNGLFVETVLGKTPAENSYWMLYENGALAATGVSGVNIKNGALYALKAEEFS